ncbi:MAG: polysaccharide deacetylase family protein, partial [Chitinivibrionales bacterium]
GNYDISNGPVDKRRVYLTFDGSYYNNVTGDILDTLRSRGVKATMFLTGTYIRKYPETVKRIVQEGHVVGNHTFSHPHLTTYQENRRHTTKPGIGPERIRRELSMNDSLFKGTVGRGMKSIWRAPYGERNREICRWAKECGYIHIGWKRARSPRYNYDTYDWVPDRETPGYFTPMEILEKFKRLSESSQNGMNGAIILMHLGSTRKRREEMVHTILGGFVDMMRDKGYSFSVVTDMVPEGA